MTQINARKFRGIARRGVSRGAGAVIAVIVSLLVCSSAAQAATRLWNNPAGGTFGLGTNWQGNVAPGTADLATFNLNSIDPYTVTLAAPATIRQMYIDQDNLLLDLAGQQLTISSTVISTSAPLSLAQTVGATAQLQIIGGNLSALDARVGEWGNAIMTVSGGAKLSSLNGTVYQGFREGASGTVTLTGAGTSWTSYAYFVGNYGTGTLTVSNGASLITRDLGYVGSDGDGTATITGQGSSWTGSAYIGVGVYHQGTLTVNDGATMSVNVLNLASNTGSNAVVNVDGATAAARTAVTLALTTSFASQGSGTLNLSNGALFSVGTIAYAGSQPGGNATINIGGAAAGNNAELRIATDLVAARASATTPSYGGGNATFNIGVGGKMSVGGTTYLGSTGSLAGTATININGGSLSIHGLIASAGSQIIHNAGEFIIEGAAYTPVSGSMSVVGATAADTATMRFINSGVLNLSGGLYVGGGAAAAGPGLGALSLESGSTANVSGPTKIWTGGDVKINGGTLKTSAIQSAGGTFAFTAGGLYLTGSNFTLGSTGLLGANLSLTTAASAPNVLSVSGTTTLDPASTLVINGGTFKTGKLVNNGGAVSYTAGSFSLTNDNLSIGAGSPVGSTIELLTGSSISVSGVVTIDAGASLTVNGGNFTAGSVVNNGSFNFLSGTLGGSADLVIDPGQMLGANFAITAGRNLSSAQNLIVGKSGTATLSITGGGMAGSTKGYIAQLQGSNGTVSISGAGSNWTLSSTLAVGGTDTNPGGVGSLTISNGAAVKAASSIRVYPAASLKLDGATLSGSSVTNMGVLELANISSVTGAITNIGTIKKTGPGTSTLNNPLINNFIVQVVAGTLNLAAGAPTGSGGFTISDGATLNFAGVLGGSPNTVLDASSSVFGAGSGTATFTSGSHTFYGTFNVPNLTIGNANVQLYGAATVPHLSITSAATSLVGLNINTTLNVPTVDMAGGRLAGSAAINISGNFNLTSSNPKTISVTALNASGNTLWTDNGSVTSSVFNNLASGTFEARHTSGQPNFSGTFNNYGTYLKQLNSAYARMSGPFNNYGAVQLNGGILALDGGGTHSGTFTNAAGSTFIIGDLSSATTTFQQASRITGAGDVTFKNGTVNFSGHFDASGTTTFYNGAFLSGADLASMGSSLLIRGSATFSTGTAQTLPATSLLSTGPNLVANDNLTVNSPFLWEGGVIAGSGRLKLNGTSTFTTTAEKKITGAVDNAGALTWNGGLFKQFGSLNNLAGGTFDIQGSNAIEIDFSASGPLPVFSNAGTVTKSAGNNSNIYPFFNNSGSVNAQTGNLIFARGSSATGTYTVQNGANLTFYFNDHAFEPASLVTGAGTVNFTEMTGEVRGNYNVSGATVVGSPTSSGATTVVTFENGATASNFGNLLTINKYANLVLNTGSTVTLHDLTIWGKLTGSDSVIIAGHVTGRGSIETTVINSGLFSPGASPGTLSIVGNYSQDPAASLEIEITKTPLPNGYVQQFDVMDITGQANLHGTLALSLLDGFVPSAMQSFRVMSFPGGRVGEFEHYTGLDIPGPLVLAPIYSNTDLKLLATTPGDATGNGTVDFADLVALAQNYDTLSGGTWARGDFNFDGKIDFADLVIIAQSYDTTLPGAIPGAPVDFGSDWSAASASAPEPSAVLWLALAAIAASRRKRHP